jgi:hypothetical protein
MYSQGDIEEAVAAGALAPEQAASLRSFVAAQNRTPHSSEEYFRLVRGYNDVFVAIACLLALSALGWLGALIPIGRRGMDIGAGAPSVFGTIFVAAGAWGLAEIFARARRTALPSFLLTLYFAFSAAMVFAVIAATASVHPGTMALLTGGSFAIGAAATWGFWLRFRVPVAPMASLGLGVIAVSAIIGFIFARSVHGPNVINVVLFLMGVGLFVYAMKVDLEDRWRITERSEVAFWLHSLAGLVLILPLAYFLGLFRNDWSVVSSIVMLGLFLLFTLIALLIDRKVYVVSCLMPLGFALYAMFQQGQRAATYGSGYGGPTTSPYAGGYGTPPYGGSQTAMQTMLTNIMWPILIIAILMVLLAIFWAPLRRAVVGILPPGARAGLPGVEATPLEQARPFQ